MIIRVCSPRVITPPPSASFLSPLAPELAAFSSLRKLLFLGSGDRLPIQGGLQERGGASLDPYMPTGKQVEVTPIHTVLTPVTGVKILEHLDRLTLPKSSH